LGSLIALAAFCRVWKPKETFEFAEAASGEPTRARTERAIVPLPARPAIVRAWMPWVFLSIVVILWGLAPVKAFLNGGSTALVAYRAGKAPTTSMVLSPTWDVPLLHRYVFRDFPVEPSAVDRAQLQNAAYRNRRAEAARYTLNWISATGSGILLAAILTAIYLRVPFGQVLSIAALTLRRMRAPLMTIALMLSLGFVTRYGGTDATLGLAFTRTGVLYPFFATLLGWLGVALTGSDTSSNVLFGSLQKITAQQLGFNPVLIVTANSTGGV